MPKAIDWMYFRKSCTTCQKAQTFLVPAGTAVRETVNATKTRIGPDEALKLLAGVERLVAMKGKKVEVFDLIGTARPDDATLLTRMIGPTGNLRAPTLRIGSTLLVGFNEDAYRQALGM